MRTVRGLPTVTTLPLTCGPEVQAYEDLGDVIRYPRLGGNGRRAEGRRGRLHAVKGEDQGGGEEFASPSRRWYTSPPRRVTATWAVRGAQMEFEWDDAKAGEVQVRSLIQLAKRSARQRKMTA
jgi:hypothetical protein